MGTWRAVVVPRLRHTCSPSHSSNQLATAYYDEGDVLQAIRLSRKPRRDALVRHRGGLESLRGLYTGNRLPRRRTNQSGVVERVGSPFKSDPAIPG